MGISAQEKNIEDGFFENECMLIYDYYTLDILEVNRACQAKYGYSKKEFLSKKITDLGEKYREPVSGFNGDVLNSDSLQLPAVWKHYRKDGSSFYVQYTFHQLKRGGKYVQLCVLHDISDKFPEVEQNLHQLPRIDTLRERLPLATIEWSRSGKIRDWSPKAESLFEWNFEQILGKSLFDTGIIQSDIRDFVESKIHEMILNHNSYFTFDSKTVLESGQTIYSTWHNSANYDQSGKLLSIYSLIEDITERKTAEDKLKESEQRFRVLSEASTVGVYLLQDGKLKYVNPMFCEISGYSKNELLQSIDPVELIHENDIGKLKALRERFHNSEIDSFEVDARALSKNESEIFVKIYGSKIMLDDRIAIMGVVIDQTKQMDAQKKLNYSIQSYKDLFNSIGDAIYIHNSDGAFIEANRTAQEIFGYNRDEIIGKDPMLLAAPGKVNKERTFGFIEKALKGEMQRFEWWGKRKNGEIFPNEVTLNPGKYFGKDVVIAMARDISQQHEQQKELKHSEELFRQLFQNAPVGIAMLDNHNEVQMVNKSFEEIFEYKIDDIKGLNIDDLIAPDEELDVARKLSNSSETFEVMGSRKTKSGKIVDVLIYGVPVKVDGKTISIYGLYVDITDQKNAESKLKSSLKEKEVLLAEIHHRVKNNLAVITGLLDLQSHSTENLDVQEALKDSQMRINTMALIHEKLYQNETLSNINFAKYIKDLVDVIDKTHRTDSYPIQIQLDLEPVEFTITQAIPCGLLLNEIFTNAYKHAFDDSFKGEAKLCASLSMDEEQNIKLEISDNGLGLPGEFENLGETSLGLTLIKTLNRQLNAEMSVNSADGTAYTFSFKLEK
jgi:PAS domain S-box-containing protein